MKKNWLIKKKEGLYCIPGNFYLDPSYPVDLALITHSHTDHARPGNNKILATNDTINIMKIRYGKNYCNYSQKIDLDETINVNGVNIKFISAGHIIGSAQIYLEYKGEVVIISGDYKRRKDATCAPFEVKKCHTFITEATFGLPIFTHPEDKQEAKKIIKSMENNKEYCHLIGVYALGKCQRLITILRELGFNDIIYLHGALMKISEYYKERKINLGIIKNISELRTNEYAGKLILCPPSSLSDRWSQKFRNVIKGFVSGWMSIKQRVKQKNIELPIVISDHADWNELLNTIKDVSPNNVLVTHGREEGLLSYLMDNNIKCNALNLVGFEDEDD
tara:strand:+ start:4957 stop:5958 length:1002 start_codon:yes stop_codon:yes gene_type:complete